MKYKDSEGRECNLPTLCRREPTWACATIETLQAQLKVMADVLVKSASAIATLQDRLYIAVGALQDAVREEHARCVSGTNQAPEIEFCHCKPWMQSAVAFLRKERASDAPRRNL